MYINTLKKNKITLSDYSYKKDIENRLFLATLTPFEVEVLQELTYFSSKFDIEDLEEALSRTADELMPILDHLSKTGLLLRKDSTIFVDKDVRKYFESQLILFEEDFEADFEYVQKLLKKVPISTLPVWYSIPRTSDNIFQSIVDKYLLTPKQYEKHLQELVFEEPLCRQILDELLENPTEAIALADLRNRYTISKEKLTECLLLLEFHLACVVYFTKADGQYEEVVSLFKEYKDFLLWQKKTKPLVLDLSGLSSIQETPFGFLTELQTFLKAQSTPDSSTDEKFLEKCIQLGFISGYNGSRLLTDDAQYFLTLSTQEQAFLLFRKTLEGKQRELSSDFGVLEKHVHELERALAELAFDGWISFDCLMQALSTPIGTQKPVQLTKVGKKWRYLLPTYTEEEKLFIHFVVCELFFEMGITSIALKDERPCFKVTPFGHIVLND